MSTRQRRYTNGVYYNSCRGSIVLSSGTASSKFGSFKCVVEEDKAGPYVLPTDHAVIAVAAGLAISPGKPDLFVRTDGSPTSRRIGARHSALALARMTSTELLS